MLVNCKKWVGWCNTLFVYLTLFPVTGNNGDSPDLERPQQNILNYNFEGELRWQKNRNSAPMNLVFVPSHTVKNIAATPAGTPGRAKWRSPASATIPLARSPSWSALFA
jgi:hypothetical protein